MTPRITRCNGSRRGGGDGVRRPRDRRVPRSSSGMAIEAAQTSASFVGGRAMPIPCAAELARCQITYEQTDAHDPSCLHAWAENRRQFLWQTAPHRSATLAGRDVPRRACVAEGRRAACRSDLNPAAEGRVIRWAAPASSTVSSRSSPATSIPASACSAARSASSPPR